jgi:two-component system, OmpR family, sensor histidine kinase BaeS
MRIGITSKLFLAVLATSILVAMVMAVTGKVRFQRDFQNYVEAGENRRIESLAETLAIIHRETGDWTALDEGEGLWLALLRSTPSLPGSEAGELYGGPVPGWPHVALYDTDDHPVAGFVGADGDLKRHPVMVDGRVVGQIARKRWVGPTETSDLTFQRAQLRNFLVAALAAVLLAAVAAGLLSKTFLAPAHAIGEATHQLAAGDFGVRIKLRQSDEFGRLADDFNLLALSLKRNEEMRQRLTADVAHELRTPLTVIQGELSALRDGVRPFGPDTIDSLEFEVQVLSKLIDDLYQLALSDIGALDYHRTELDLRAECANSLMAFRDQCGARGLDLDDTGVAGAPLVIHADPDRLRQMINNLVGNSLRYTDAPGRIRIACHIAAGDAVLEISDSAPGIPEEMLPRIFERLFRVESSRNRASGGAGLGLAICKNIVEAHGGHIDASQSPLGGITITVQIPLLKSSI